MAWFGGNLRNLTENLTGQLSSVANSAASFTREVIAEGTEEVADHSTELQISQDKVKRLEAAVNSLRAENDRLSSINAELEEKAETSELQINSISAQYRSILQEKEENLKVLRQKHNTMQDFHRNMMSTAEGAMTTSTSTSSLSGSAIMTDAHDFDDVISSQQEINRLSCEVARLQAECNHWKQMVSSQQGHDQPMFQIGEDQNVASTEVTQLKAQIKHLEEKLRHEVDESQHEMSALQDSHTHKLATLKERHKKETADYQRRIESLEQMVGLGAESSPSSAPSSPTRRPDDGRDDKDLQEVLRKTRQHVAQLEEANHELEKENARLAEADKDNNKSVQTLKRKVDALERERTRLEQEVQGQSQTGSEVEEELERLKEEKEDLTKEVGQLKDIVDRQETELAVLLGSHEQASNSAILEEIHDAKRKLSSEDALRRTRLLHEKQEIVNKMIEVGQKMSDSKNTVATLESATLQISDQAAEIITDIGCTQHQDITADFINSLERENELLKHHVSRLENEIGDLNKSYEALSDDKQQCENLITSLNQQIKHLQDGDGQLRKPSTDQSRSDSEVTLAVTFESDSENSQRQNRPIGASDSSPVRRHIAYKRPLSPSDSSVTSDVSSSLREGFTSETEISSEGGFVDGKQSMAENSDAVSFDGEYDDSLMFAGIKEKYPEAAHAFQEQINQFEMVRADWEMEKQALEEVVVRMREQLKEKDRMLQDMTAQKGLIEVHREHSEDLKEKLRSLEDANKSLIHDNEMAQQQQSNLKDEVDRAESKRKELESTTSTLQEAREDLQQQVKQLESRNKTLTDELDHSSHQSKDAETAMLRLKEEKETLESEIHQLDDQHQEAMAQIIQSRDTLVQDLSKRDAQLKEQSEKLAEMESEFERAVSEKSEIVAELDSVMEDLSMSKADLADSELVKQEQSVAMTTLRTNLQSLQDTHNDLQKSYKEIEQLADSHASRVKVLEQEALAWHQSRSDAVDLLSREELQAQVVALTAKLGTTEVQGMSEPDGKVDDKMAYLEHELSRTTHEIEELNISIDDRESRLHQLTTSLNGHKHLVEQQNRELDSVKEENTRLAIDIQARDEKLKEMKVELDKSHADLHALRSNVSELQQNEKGDKSNQKKLEKTCEELQTDLLTTKEILDSTIESQNQLAELVKEKEADIRALAEENAHFLKSVEQSKETVKELNKKVQDRDDLHVNLEEVKQEVVDLKEELEEARNEAAANKSSVETNTLELITQLEMEIKTLKSSVEQKDETIKEMLASLHEKTQSATDSSKDVENLQISVGEMERILAVSKEESQNLHDMLDSKDQELLLLQKQLEIANKSISDQENQLIELNRLTLDKDSELSSLQEQVTTMASELNSSSVQGTTVDMFEQELESKNLEIKELKQQLESSQLDLENHVKGLNDASLEKDAEILELNETMQRLTQEKDRTDESMLAYKTEIEDLRKLNEQKDADVTRLREEVTNITKQLQQPAEQPMQNGEVNGTTDSIEEAILTSSPFGKSSSNVLQGQDGSISDNEKHYEKVIQEREKEIAMLQHERQSLLTRLDDKSTSTMGNSVLVDLHKNQMKVKTLESERHQMMTVLNEKTREASNLKNEVHKLLKVISAQKSALEKAQEDNKELVHTAEGPRDDMQKEALQKLSRLIQDKDLEIEALKQKNQSLLEVLQATAPNDSTQISGVLSESEKLQKENKVLKEERDQLVVSIHQKHQESLTYYEEVQRLVGVINTEVQKSALIHQKCEALEQDVDLKNKSLTQAQADLDDVLKAKTMLEDEIHDHKQSVSLLQNQSSDLNDQISQLNQKNKEMEDNELLSSEKVSQMEHEIEEYKQRVEDLSKRQTIIQEPVITVQSASIQEMAPPSSDITAKVLEEKEAEIVKLKEQLEHHNSMSQTPAATAETEEKNEEIGKLKDQLESQGYAMLEMDGLIRDRSVELEKRKEEMATMKGQLDKQDQTILDRDAVIQQQNNELQRVGLELQSKMDESRTLQQRTQQMSTRLQTAEQQLASSRQEITNLEHSVHNKDGELRQQQDFMSRLAAEVREKDFELGALRDKCGTLTKLVQESEADTQGEVRRLLTETEAMQTQAQRFQHERDQSLLALERSQGDLQHLQQEFQARVNNEVKLTRELDRLRTHLIQMEDTYTQEALQSEEREKDLRTKLNVALEHAHTSSTAVQSASKEANAQIENLLDQLTTVSEQKDQALLQLAQSQEESQQYAMSLNNLQLVLEQFQQEKDTFLAAEVEVYQRKAQEKEKVAADLMKQNVDLQEKLYSAQEALDVASRLSEQLDKKEEAVEKLRDEMHKKDEVIDEFKKRFQEVSSTNETKVDKPLVKNLFMNYVMAPQNKKQEVVKLISSVLNFSQDELHKVGVDSPAGGGWLSGFFRRGNVTPTSTPPATPTKPNTSFSQQFVKFLEVESTPKHSPRLPVEEMSQDRHRGAAYNPFSAPIPHQSPFIQPGSPGTSPRGPGAAHAFVKSTGLPASSISSATPTLAPVPAFTPVPVAEGAPSGRGSPRGRAGSAGGLRDILQSS